MEERTSTKAASPNERRTRADIAPLLRELKTALEDLYGDRLAKLILYGSFARGEAWEGSDIDVMVVLRGDVDAWEEIKRMSDAVYLLELRYEELIAALPLSQRIYESRRSPLLINVRREGAVL